MQIALGEIWSFLDLVGEKANEFKLSLKAGDFVLENITSKDIEQLRHDESFDVEMLPSLFTYREILWQPDVYKEVEQCLAPLRILKAYCEEAKQTIKSADVAYYHVYENLLGAIGQYISTAIEDLTDKKISVTDALGKFRLGTFPIIKFFIYHPMNRGDYHIDAVNRMNYAVRIMLTQFYGQYSQLQEPVWIADK